MKGEGVVSAAPRQVKVEEGGGPVICQIWVSISAVKINTPEKHREKAVVGAPERLLDTDTTHVVAVMVRGVGSALTSERIFPRA